MIQTEVLIIGSGIAGGTAVLQLADALKGRNALIMNAGASDDRLREADCRPNVVHTAPSRAMLADGLAQYLVWKQWRRWFLVRGTGSDDEAFAEALRRARPDVALAVIPRADHFFKAVRSPDPVAQLARYLDPALPLVPDLVNALDTWVAGIARP